MAKGAKKTNVVRKSMMSEKQKLPKNIWCAWHQGLENAPEHVQRIVQLWRDFNPEYELTVLEEPDVSDMLADQNIDPSRLTPQVKANIIRSLLLKTHGGVWVDATLLPVKSLRDWLEPLMERTVFFRLHQVETPI